MAELILVDESDEQVGTAPLPECHSGDGVLHRAFTILISNRAGEILIQRRSASKPLWPLRWEASCSGHPVVGEEVPYAAARRLPEELGFETPLEDAGSFRYQARWKDEGSENELCHLLAGTYNGEVRPDPSEVAEYAWVDPDELTSRIESDREAYAPWLVIALDMIRSGMGA